MSEERIRGGTSIFGLLLLIACVCLLITVIYIAFVQGSAKTTNVTIEHLWEEEGKYYFADSEGVIYRIERPRGEVMYETIPKTRFAKIKEGWRYQVEYENRFGWAIRFSLSEKEIER